MRVCVREKERGRKREGERIPKEFKWAKRSSVPDTLTFLLSPPLKTVVGDVIVNDPSIHPSSIEAPFVSRKLDFSIIFGELKFFHLWLRINYVNGLICGLGSLFCQSCRATMMDT